MQVCALARGRVPVLHVAPQKRRGHRNEREGDLPSERRCVTLYAKRVPPAEAQVPKASQIRGVARLQPPGSCQRLAPKGRSADVSASSRLMPQAYVHVSLAHVPLSLSLIVDTSVGSLHMQLASIGFPFHFKSWSRGATAVQ